MKIIEFHKRIILIMKIIEFYMRINKKMKNIEFHKKNNEILKSSARIIQIIMKIIKISEFQWRIKTNHGNPRIPCQNH